jgi:alpha-L-arabinofuranosidase
LNAASLGAWNSFKEPDRVKIVHTEAQAEANNLPYRFPAHSITKLTVRLQ